MKKVLKILPIISLVTVILHIQLMLLCLLFRGPLAEWLYGYGKDELPLVIPVSSVLQVFGQLAAMVWLFYCIGNRKFGIWAELLGAGWLSVVLPLLINVISMFESRFLGRIGYEHLAARNALLTLWSYAGQLCGYAVPVALIACGMSMAYKYFVKNDRQL